MCANKCRICGGAQFKKIGELCSNMKIMGPQFSEGKSDIVVCMSCGFVFNDYENANQSCFDEYYRSSSSRTMEYYDIFSRDAVKRYFEHFLSNIKDFITKDSRILDVAGGHGHMAQFLIENGYPNVTVLELKPQCIQSIKEKKISVLEGSLFQTQESGDYDLVVCDHSLEHFVDIDIAIKKLKGLAKPNGHIYIEVPNVEEYTKREQVPYYFLTYEHVCHFSEQTLKCLATRFGMRMLYLNKCLKGDDYPTLCAMFENNITTAENRLPETQSQPVLISPSDVKNDFDIHKDLSAETAIREYISSCERKLAKRLQQFEMTYTPLILWGIGASTAQLLNRNFDQCNVIQLIDGNPARQGLSFRVGKHVLKVDAPTDIKNQTATILILSSAYKKSIEKSIRDYQYANKIMSL